jgi:hypothetical protein
VLAAAAVWPGRARPSARGADSAAGQTEASQGSGGEHDRTVGPRGRPGQPRRRPAKLHGDKGYDYPTCQRTLRRRGITARIARRGLASTHPAAERGVAVEGIAALRVASGGPPALMLGFARLPDIASPKPSGSWPKRSP